MNGVYSPGSCEAHEVLAHREKELNELLNNIDSLQEEVDDLNQKISSEVRKRKLSFSED